LSVRDSFGAVMRKSSNYFDHRAVGWQRMLPINQRPDDIACQYYIRPNVSCRKMRKLAFDNRTAADMLQRIFASLPFPLLINEPIDKNGKHSRYGDENGTY